MRGITTCVEKETVTCVPKFTVNVLTMKEEHHWKREKDYIYGNDGGGKENGR